MEPPQTHTQFKNRGQAMAMRCWAHPEQDNTQQPTYLQPGPFIPNLALFSHKCSSLTPLNVSFPQLQSFSWAYSFFTCSFHHVAGERESPLLFPRAATHGSSIHPFPLLTRYQRSSRAQSGSALLPEHHRKMTVLIKEKPNFSLMQHTERTSDPCYHSTFSAFISKTEYKQK